MSGLRSRLGRVSPNWVRDIYERIAAAYEFFGDYRDFISSTRFLGRSSHYHTPHALDARITMAYHGLEKGPTVPEPHRPYGVNRAIELRRLIGAAQRSGQATFAVERAEEALEGQELFNSTGAVSDAITPVLDSPPRRLSSEAVHSFVDSRHSVRAFDIAMEVDEEDLREALRIASSTPSVCNRRSYCAHVFRDRKTITRILDLQQGAHGFEDSVPVLIAVTTRRSESVGIGERNQRWIDGGLFAMNVVWGLHAQGLGTCFLNWSKRRSETERLRRIAAIPPDEDVIVLIATGHLVKGCRVARSPRRPEDWTAQFHS